MQKLVGLTCFKIIWCRIFCLPVFCQKYKDGDIQKYIPGLAFPIFWKSLALAQDSSFPHFEHVSLTLLSCTAIPNWIIPLRMCGGRAFSWHYKAKLLPTSYIIIVFVSNPEFLKLKHTRMLRFQFDTWSKKWNMKSGW